VPAPLIPNKRILGPFCERAGITEEWNPPTLKELPEKIISKRFDVVVEEKERELN